MTETGTPSENTSEGQENLIDTLQRESRETLGLDLEAPPLIVDLPDEASE
ncbi:hypothetical protein [Mycobacteroides chelonae]|nr:hypothetical protein [Mycobacteroides chelonae]